MNYLHQRIRSFGYALAGITTFFASQAHAKIHLLAILLITLLGFYLGLDKTEWCLIVLCMALVLCLEAVNTAIEFTVDLVSPAQHPLAKKAKDVAAGAVLLAVVGCGLVWAIIFVPKLLLKFGSF